MKQIINGRTYNTETMTILAANTVYYNGNVAGSDSIRKTPGGLYALVHASNGQDPYRHRSIQAIQLSDIASLVEGWDIDDNEIETLTALGVISPA